MPCKSSIVRMADSGNARNFHHPFIPYDIQIEFMNAVYDCIEDRKVGILESPTGERPLYKVPSKLLTVGRNRE